MKEIPLTRGKVALVDDEDFDRVSQFKWSAYENCGLWYATRRAKVSERESGAIATQNISLHRYILNPPSDVLVDHRNGNGLDCQKDNMRLATHTQNTQNQQRLHKTNKSGYRGAYVLRGKWRASIRVNHKFIWLGTFKNGEEAARAYDAAAIKYRGEFASPNFKAIDGDEHDGGTT